MSKNFEIYCLDGDSKTSKGCVDTFGEAAKLAVNCAHDGKDHEVYEHRNPDAWCAWVKAGPAKASTPDNDANTCEHDHSGNFLICCDNDVVHAKAETFDRARELSHVYAHCHHVDLVVYDAAHKPQFTMCCHGHEVKMHDCERASA